jgi:hypothetical protein
MQPVNKSYQPSLFDPTQQEGIVFDMKEGKRLGEIGLSLAVENAERKEKDWKKHTWQLFLVWLRRNVKRGQEFKVEDFRMHIEVMGLMEDPPCKTAYGFIGKRVKYGFFEFVKKDATRSKKGHGANANVWRKL